MSALAESRTERPVRLCPFCGGLGKLMRLPDTLDWWRVRCLQDACGATTWAIKGAEGALAAWNRRQAGGTS